MKTWREGHEIPDDDNTIIDKSTKQFDTHKIKTISELTLHLRQYKSPPARKVLTLYETSTHNTSFNIAFVNRPRRRTVVLHADFRRSILVFVSEKYVELIMRIWTSTQQKTSAWSGQDPRINRLSGRRTTWVRRAQVCFHPTGLWTFPWQFFFRSKISTISIDFDCV